MPFRFSPNTLRTLRWILLVVPLLCVVGVPLQAQRPTPVIVDTDVAEDDLVALLYILNSPEVRVVGITTVNGVARPEAGARNIMRLLAATGHRDIPVVVGAEKPLAGDHAFPKAWREAAERLEGIDLPAAAEGTLPDGAHLWLRRAVRASPEKVSVLALGPLTNLALALADSPDLCPKIQRIVWLGGAAFVRGNVDPWPAHAGRTGPRGREWNAYIDPVAAAQVLNSGCRVEMVPLDVVYEMPLRAAMAAKVEKGATGPSPLLAAQLLRQLLTSPWQDGRAYAADAVAAVALTHPGLVRERALAVEMITSRGHAGETRIVRQGRKPNARVALSISARAAERLLLSRLMGASAGR